MNTVRWILGIFFGMIWILISGSTAWYSLILAALVAILGSYLSTVIMGVSFERTHLLELSGRSSTPFLIRSLYVAAFLPLFALEIMLSAVSVSLFVLRPDDIYPGLLRYDLELRNSLAITILANLVTLTPGTMTMACEFEDSVLFIHSLTARTQEDRIKTLAGVKRLEKWVGRIIE